MPMQPVKSLTHGKHWTRTLICARIREWAEKHGRVPMSADIAADKTRDERGVRQYPQHTQVAAHYPTWDDMLRDAGLEPPSRRNHHKPKHRVTLHPRQIHR